MPSVEYAEGIKETQEFVDSPRGRLLMAQALYLGIRKLSECESIMREESNIADMNYILHVMYPNMEQLFDQVYINNHSHLQHQGLK